MLIQKDHITNTEFVIVHSVCLEYIEVYDETENEWTAMTWEASRDFVEELLAPAARPPFLRAIDWRPGDLLLFNNLKLQHSVTPTDVYAMPGQQR